MTYIASLRRPRLFRARMTLAVALFALQTGLAYAQSGDTPSVRLLKEELARRDAAIIDLQNRVKALEEQRDAARSGKPVTPQSPSPSQSAARTAQASAANPGSRGGLDVDEIAAERALERVLVQEGVSLLRPGYLEFTPAFSFQTAHEEFPALVTTNTGTFLGSRRVSRNLFDWSLGVSVGLPYDAQLEIFAPYGLVDQSSTSAIAGTAQSHSDSWGSGFGDLQVGLAKTLYRSGSSQTKVIGRVTWITGTGAASDNGVFTGFGNAGVNASLSASWQRDPVVFFANTGYTHYYGSGTPAFANGGNFTIGDAAGLSFGTALALSPESALTFSMDQVYEGEYKIAGQRQPGTDILSSTFSMSASTALWSGAYLRIRAGIGVTPDAPDYQFGISIPILLDAR